MTRHAPRGTTAIPANRRVGLLTALLLLVAALAGSATAAPGEGVELVGSSTGWVDIWVRELVTIPESEITITSKGRYAGFYMVPDTATRQPVGALALPALGAGAGGSSGGAPFRLGESYDVAPGTYRLYLLADSPTTVHIPIPNHAYQRLAPRARASSGLRLLDYALPAAEQRGERRIGMHVRRPTLTVAAQLVASDGFTGVDHVTTCLVAAGRVCERPPARTTRVPFVSSGRSVVAGIAQPAAYDAVFAVERGLGIHADTKVKAASFTLVL